MCKCSLIFTYPPNDGTLFKNSWFFTYPKVLSQFLLKIYCFSIISFSVGISYCTLALRMLGPCISLAPCTFSKLWCQNEICFSNAFILQLTLFLFNALKNPWPEALKNPWPEAARPEGSIMNRKSLGLGENRLIPIIPVLVDAQHILIVCSCYYWTIEQGSGNLTAKVLTSTHNEWGQIHAWEQDAAHLTTTHADNMFSRGYDSRNGFLRRRCGCGRLWKAVTFCIS